MSAATGVPRAPARRTLLWAAGLASVLVLFAYRDVLGLPLLGWDSYPLIAATGVDERLGPFRLLGQELMGGRYPDGHFYRPLVTLSFAIDRALHGLAPLGYHVTDLLVLVLNGALVAAVTLRLFGARAQRAALCACALFVLHPIQLEVVPFAPRRADALCLAFLLAGLCAVPRAAAAFRTRHAVLGFLWALLAAGSKETGAIAPVLVCGLATLEGTPGPGGRLRRGLVRAAPAALGTLVYLAARTSALAGLGGHAESSLANVASLPRLVLPYLVRVLYPQPLLGAGPGAQALVVAFAAALGALSWWSLRRATPVDPAQRTGLGFLALWVLVLFGVSSLAGRVHDWYAMLFTAPYAVLLGVLLDAGLAAAKRRRAMAAALTLGAALPLAAGHLGASALARPYTNLIDAGRLAEETLGRLDRALARGQEGGVIEFTGWVPLLPPHSDGSEVRGLFLFADYSLQAYCELVAPDQRPRVSVWQGYAQSPIPGALAVQLVPGPPPAWIERR